MKKNIVWFKEINKDNISIVGGKGANLGEMVNVGLPIPYGFMITAKAYFDFIESNKLDNKIKEILNAIDYEQPTQLHTASNQIRQMIENTPFPRSLANQISQFYNHLLDEEAAEQQTVSFKKIKRRIHVLYKNPSVAVRSSATAEDLPTASFAGQQDTFLNVKGESNLFLNVRKCWSSLFTERAIYYRHQQGFDKHKVGLAVVVQRMIQSDKSGIAFSIDPVTNDRSKITIEAIFGLGEYIVGGKVTPDHYITDKSSLVILEKKAHYQNLKLIRSGTSNKEIKLSKAEGSKEKLTDEEIIKLAMLVKEIEKHYEFPQDIEWAIEKDKVYIVQSRPITTIKDKEQNSKFEIQNLNLKNLLLTGSPASPGIATGPVNLITDPSQINKIKSGDVLVAPQTNPDYVPAMKRAVAIITEKGGRTSHAAIVSRELGIPAVVGADKVTSILKDEMIVTVNGATGEIYKGKVMIESKKNTNLLIEKKIKTLTKVYVNLAQPEHVEEVAKKDVDGIGLLRAEFMIAEIGVHPKEFIKQKKQQVFINKLAKNLIKFSYAFHNRPVIYRATDFKTNEYRNLTGGYKYEAEEENPMLGFRGASRYIVNPDVFKMELEAIRKVWDEGLHNLHLMIPFVRVPWELIRIKEYVKSSGLLDLPDFKLWIMVEVPSTALGLEQFLKLGIDGVSIGTNDLTMMLLGVDRDNQEIAGIYDERSPVVIETLKLIVKKCQEYNVTCSICGQAASDYPEIVEELVKLGITSVSINPDAIYRTRQLIYDIEKKHYKKNT